MVVVLLFRATGSQHLDLSRCGTGSALAAHWPSGPAACDIFPDQGSDLCPLHWRADSLPLGHQGSSRLVITSGPCIIQVCFIFPSVLFPVPGLHPGYCFV